MCKLQQLNQKKKSNYVGCPEKTISFYIDDLIDHNFRIPLKKRGAYLELMRWWMNKNMMKILMRCLHPFSIFPILTY